MLKKIILLSCAFSLFTGVEAVGAAASASSTVRIVAVYPNAPGAAEKGHEFITVKNINPSKETLNDLAVRLKGSDKAYQLYGISLEKDESLSIYPSFSLPNSGGSVQLIAMDTLTVLQEVVYPELEDDEAWTANNEESWTATTPEPATKKVGPEELEAKDEELCAASGLHITEVFADPAGSDKEGGEFVELFNPTTDSISLAGCTVVTDKLAKGQKITLPSIIASESYVAISFKDGLVNTGGTVIFISEKEEVSVEYPALSSGRAWALIDGTWQVTTSPSPGAKNSVPSIEAEEDADTSPASTATPCPAGKFRNPETNRCKSVANDVEDFPAPCKQGQERNPETNRCRTIATVASTTLTPCDPGEERNAATNRCRKITTLSSGSGSASTAAKGAPEPETAQNSRTNFLIIGAVAVAAIGYGIFEYRREIGNYFVRLKTAFTKRQ